MPIFEVIVLVLVVLLAFLVPSLIEKHLGTRD